MRSSIYKARKVHFVGIGGIGVSAVARLALALEKKVTGSDIVASDITRKLEKMGAKIASSHDEKNLKKETELVIYSPAVPKENAEIIKAKTLRIKTLSYPQVLGELSHDYYTIAVSGTHGKGTTTALTGLIFENAGFDPTVVVGTLVPKWRANFRKGNSKYLVVEGCEYRGHMLELSPSVIVLTNIEADHLDYYKNIAHIRNTFQKYIDKLKKNNFLIYNADDLETQKLNLKKIKRISYGIKKDADLKATEIKIKSGEQEFKMRHKNKLLGRVCLKVPGIFNIYNALAASALSLEFAVSPKIIRETLFDFKGCSRRFEKVGEIDGALIISDYGHHPTEVKNTILGAKEFYPKRRIFVIFQPHQHARTKKLFKDFIKSFNAADFLIISEIYDVAGREEKEYKDISSEDLVREIGRRKPVLYGRDLEETHDLILRNIKKNDLVLIMGAGNIDTVARSIVKKYGNKRE